jgi:phage terminase small subunit
MKPLLKAVAGGTCSAAEAYRRAGGCMKNADVIASRWLRKVSIEQRIAALKGRTAEKCEVTRAEVLEFLLPFDTIPPH